MRGYGDFRFRGNCGATQLRVDLFPIELTMTTDKTKRTPCEIYTRVMWYLRPVSNYNIWKKSEFYSRKYFDEKKVDNSSFISKYYKNG